MTRNLGTHSMNATRTFLVFCTLLATAGCADEEPETYELKNEGAVCVTQNQDPAIQSVTLVADEPTKVSVLFRSCSTTCIENLETSCTAEYDPGTSTIIVTSSASWQREDVDSCNLACLVIETTCDGPTLPEGTYTILHGSSEEQITVPSTYRCERSVR